MESEKKAARLAYAKHYAKAPDRIREAAQAGLDSLTIRSIPEMGAPDDLLEVASIDYDKLWAELAFAKSLGERIARIRKAYSLTQTDLAEILSVQQGSVSRWEKNKSDPSEEVITVLGYMAQVRPEDVRYGRREPTSSGDMVPERPVLVIGELDVDGSITIYPKSKQVTTVGRPREGRPYDDVVAIMVESGFSIFQAHNWMFFYRTEIQSLPETRIGEVCVVKSKDSENLFLALILDEHDSAGGKYYTVMLPHGAIGTYAFAWASPILSFRQNIEETVA